MITMNNSNIGYRNPEVLRKLYWGERLSTRQIGKKLSVENTAILKWMRKFNIPRRPLYESKLKLTKEELEELYWNKSLSLNEIAKRFSVSSFVVLDRMKKFNIPRREPPQSIDRKALLFNFYINKNLSVLKIAKILNLSYRTIWKLLKRYGIKTRSISEASTKYSKTSFSGDLKERAYMIGLRASDLNARRCSNLIEVRLSTTHRLFIEVFKELFGKYSHVSETLWYNRKSKETIIRVSCLLDNSFEFILEKLQKIPDWILSNTELFFYFLAGYMDGDGYWVIRIDRRYVIFQFGIDTMDKEILEQINEKLKNLEFSPKFGLKSKKGNGNKYYPYRKDVYYVALRRKSHIIKLAKILLPLSRHKEKIWKMNLILESVNKKWDEIRDGLVELRKRIKETVIPTEMNMQQLNLQIAEQSCS